MAGCARWAWRGAWLLGSVACGCHASHEPVPALAAARACAPREARDACGADAPTLCLDQAAPVEAVIDAARAEAEPRCESLRVRGRGGPDGDMQRVAVTRRAGETTLLHVRYEEVARDARLGGLAFETDRCNCAGPAQLGTTPAAGHTLRATSDEPRWTVCLPGAGVTYRVTACAVAAPAP